MFADKRLGIALIVASVVWLILDQLFSLWLGVLPAVVLVFIGIQEIRWSKKTRTGDRMVGLADVVLAVFLLLSAAWYYINNNYYSYYDYSYYHGISFVGALYILGLIVLGATVALFILVTVNRKKVGQRVAALWVAIVLLAIVFLAHVLDLFYNAAVIQTFAGIVLAYPVLMAVIIIRAVDLFPMRPRVIRAVGVPASGSAVGGNPLDAPSGGFAALCFFIPLVGLILYLVWKDEYPLKARSCGKGALIGVIVYLGMSCLSVVLAIIVPMMLMF
jgi:hypothetical protein